jgi:hypothetical protein
MLSRGQCLRALEVHEEALAQLQNVVGLGVVMLDDAAEGKTAGNAVAVYVDHKVPESQIEPDQVIPEYLEVKGRGETLRIPIKVIEQGKVEFESAPGESSDESHVESHGKEPL